MHTVDRPGCSLMRYLKAAELLFVRVWLIGIKEIQNLVVPSSHFSFTQNSLHLYLRYTLITNSKSKAIPYQPTLCSTKCGETLAVSVAGFVHVQAKKV